jgi:amino acid transporter
MNVNPDHNPLNDPEFIRERAAWLKIGAHSLALHVGVGVLALGLVVGIASAVLDMESHHAVTTMVTGTWLVIFCAGMFAEFTARNRARRGGVQVDRF